MGCSNSHVNTSAITSSQGMGRGGDIDAAVLAALNCSGTGPTQKLSLSFKCEELVDLDAMSKSDPFCIIYKKMGESWNSIGKTETIYDNLNPEFVKKVFTEFHFERNE